MKRYPARYALFALLTICSCEHAKTAGTTPNAGGEPAATTKSSESGATAPTVTLAETPRIDLVDNRFRWHVYREGLVVPFASEGFHKYAHEYGRPFGEVVEVEGRSGRVLSKSTATLRIPVSTSNARVLRLFAHGLTAGQRVAVDINGKSVGTVDLPNEWTEVRVDLEPGALVVGENEIRLRPRSAGRAGSKKSYALWYALELGETGEAEGYPPVVPWESGKPGQISGFAKMETYVEIPPAAWLTVETGAAATIKAVTEGGEERVLLDGKSPPGAQLLDLSALSDKLVRLSFESSGPWLRPAIAVEQQATRELPRFENAILLVVDALRADRLSLYGKTRVQTPRFTAAAKEGAVFLNNQAASPSSPPSHASIQTGMIPRVHGVVGDKGKLNSGVELISTKLGKAGFATAYVGNNSFGMSRLATAGQWTKSVSPIASGKGQDCAEVISEVLAFITAQQKAGKRFFVSALPIEPHAPYRFHEGVSSQYHEGAWTAPIGKNVTGHRLEDIIGGRVKMDDHQWSQLRALYDGEVEHMDQCFGALQDGLVELGVASKTAIVLTADHGEGMGERDRLGHAYGHFGELSNVPFVVFAPGLAGPVEVATVTGHLDIAPTVLDLLGVEPGEAIQGNSVLGLIGRDGAWTPRVVSLEYGRSYALRSARWKLIVEYSGKELLFDYLADPLDQNDVGGENPMALRYMRDMSGFFLEHRSEWRTATWGTLNDHHAGAFQ